MAPEQLAGKGSSVQSDIYALGLVLYELFTGRKAFEAATLAEWRRKHAEEQPTSPSTVTPGFDPVVERVILRCLEKDPKARPRSVAAVAAALPGGDPLAAAIAAGETPSPEMVAAAGDRGAITPRTARLVIVAVVVLLGFVMFANRYTNLFEMVPLEKPPDALVDRAKEIVRKLGYTEEPADTAQGFHAAGEYLQFLEQRDATASRWKALATGWPAVHFWYRQSPRDLVAWNVFRRRVPDPGPGGSGRSSPRGIRHGVARDEPERKSLLLSGRAAPGRPISRAHGRARLGASLCRSRARPRAIQAGDTHVESACRLRQARRLGGRVPGAARRAAAGRSRGVSRPARLSSTRSGHGRGPA